jgi:hypothetical protein
MEQQHEPQGGLELSPQLVTIMTTEHYTPQSAQGQEVSDVNGRTSLYIGAVSGALIALAFVGQISRVGTAFFVFSLVLFPSLVFMGVVTFERVTQSTYAVITYARGVNRIRHLYLEYAPQLRPYFILSAHDDTESVTGSLGITSSRWQIFLITPGMIAVINSVLVGTFAGLLLSFVFALPLWVCVSVAVAVLTFVLSVALHQRYHWQYFKRTERLIPSLFPSEREQ